MVLLCSGRTPGETFWSAGSSGSRLQSQHHRLKKRYCGCMSWYNSRLLYVERLCVV